MRSFFFAGVITVSIASVCIAMTVEEYNGLSEDTQNVALSRIVTGTYEMARNQGATEEWQSCVREFFSQQRMSIAGSSEMGIPGVHAVLDQIDLANEQEQHDLRVEDLVFGTMNFHCGEP